MRGLKAVLAASSLLMLTLAVAGPALAQSDEGPVVQPRIERRDSSQDQGPRVLERGESQPEVSGEAAEQQGGVLPFTGAHLTLFALAGITAVGAGVGLMRRARRDT
ncbi:MAG: hypothetical protein ACRDJ5_02350 [Actinomycetota bacterium]